MNSPGFAPYEINEINRLSAYHRTDTDRIGRGILRVGGYWWGSGGLGRNMTIPRQLTLGEGNGQIKGKAQPKPLRRNQAVQGGKSM